MITVKGLSRHYTHGVSNEYKPTTTQTVKKRDNKNIGGLVSFYACRAGLFFNELMLYVTSRYRSAKLIEEKLRDISVL